LVEHLLLGGVYRVEVNVSVGAVEVGDVRVEGRRSSIDGHRGHRAHDRILGVDDNVGHRRIVSAAGADVEGARAIGDSSGDEGVVEV